jgi:outer membrane protein assembly factor BamB
MSEPNPSSWLRRLRVPLIAVAVPLIFLALLAGFDRADVVPEAVMPLLMLFQLTALLALVVVPIWFLFFSGFELLAKCVGVLVVLLMAGALVAMTRDVDFSAKMAPILIFRWQPDLQAEFSDRLTKATPDAPTLTPADLAVVPEDFPRYRGVHGDGVASSAIVSEDWQNRPPKEIWRTTVGWSYAGIAVAGKVAITLEQRNEDEAVVCYDRATGKELWSYRYPAQFKHTRAMGGGGPRSTPTIADGHVYSLGAVGDLVCLDGVTGTKRWAVNILTDNGAKVVEWGMTGSPLIVGELVVVNAGVDPSNNQSHAVAAYERKTGNKAWATGEFPAGYSSPMLATINRGEQIVLFDGGGVAGIDPLDGKQFWRHPWKTFQDMNIMQPLLLPGNRVLISSQATNGCAMLEVTGASVKEIWHNRNLAAHFANPIYYAGHIYGLHKGLLCCLDAETGERRWETSERFGSGQLLLTGNTLLLQTEQSGELIAAVADPAEYRELGRIRVFRGSRTWNTPSLAGGRLYLRNHEEMVCLDLGK